METPSYADQKHAVLITGGTSGIGLGLAARYRARGDRVLVTGRDEKRLQQAADTVVGIEVFVSDIGDPAQRESLASHVAEVMPEIDTVVNNAGIQRRVSLAADHGPWSSAQNEIEVLLGGPVHLNRLLIPALLAHGRPAAIANVTSGGAYVPQPFAPVYSASKAALRSYTMNLRYALAQTPVRVIELIPPAVATPLMSQADRHGADVDEFCDTVFPGLDGSAEEVGFGPTASPEVTALIRAQRDLFDASAARAQIQRY